MKIIKFHLRNFDKIGLVARVSGRHGFTPTSRHTKDIKNST